VNHADVKKHLADYLEGDLALDDRALVDAHLDHCEACAREVRQMQQTIRLLRLMPEPETPPMIAANVMRRIRAGESRPGFWRRLSGGLGAIFEPSFMLPASAVAAAALVVMVAQGPGESGLQAFWRSASPTSPSGVEAASANRKMQETQAAKLIGMPSLNAALPTFVTGTVTGQTPARNVASSAARRRAAGSAVARRRFDANTLGATLDGTLNTAERATPRRRFFSDPVLSPAIPTALVPDVYVANGTGRVVVASSLATLVRDRFAGTAPAPGALSVSQTLASQHLGKGFGTGLGTLSSGGEDPRDAWLAKGLEDPVNFARFLGAKSLAEQELWVARLSERAEARGLLGELVLSLQASGDDTASWLAADFLARAERAQNVGDAGLEPSVR